MASLKDRKIKIKVTEVRTITFETDPSWYENKGDTTVEEILAIEKESAGIHPECFDADFLDGFVSTSSEITTEQVFDA